MVSAAQLDRFSLNQIFTSTRKSAKVCDKIIRGHSRTFADFCERSRTFAERDVSPKTKKYKSIIFVFLRVIFDFLFC